jgi:hypothetical protein
MYPDLLEYLSVFLSVLFVISDTVTDIVTFIMFHITNSYSVYSFLVTKRLKIGHLQSWNL